MHDHATPADASPAAPPHARRLDQSQAEVAALEQQVEALADSQLEHLRELAMLNKMSDLLSIRRPMGEILAHAASEAARVLDAEHAWVWRLHRSDDDAHWSRPGAARPDRIPTEAADLRNRLLYEPEPSLLVMPAYDGSERVFVGLPLASAAYRIGAMVLQCPSPHLATQSPRLRLVTSLAMQTAAGAESSMLFANLSQLIVNTVISIVAAIESRDPYTGGHSMRVTAYSLALAHRAGFDEAALSRLRMGGLLHDVGKVGVPDAILRKPGRLTDDEFEVIKRHPSIGDDIVRHIPQFAAIRPIVRHHHERFDGRGYPDRLAGDSIDLAARVAAIADTYDAMTSDRPYRKGLTHEIARDEIRKQGAAQFDPELAGLFVAIPVEELREACDDLERWHRGGAVGADDLADALTPAA